jgi:hypothetical protein
LFQYIGPEQGKDARMARIVQECRQKAPRLHIAGTYRLICFASAFDAPMNHCRDTNTCNHRRGRVRRNRPTHWHGDMAEIERNGPPCPDFYVKLATFLRDNSIAAFMIASPALQARLPPR